eukprot:TRINITY_DN13560_c0_g2_i1.p2 TRINITY_DN13560_c0_g2~~TRINITY_DN13560_c0_g2_i1.p2  ORF type:complete len:115 (+),score=38.44 TRINITY_DN13560_c0_g2_i1:144-488(+)
MSDAPPQYADLLAQNADLQDKANNYATINAKLHQEVKHLTEKTKEQASNFEQLQQAFIQQQQQTQQLQRKYEHAVKSKELMEKDFNDHTKQFKNQLEEQTKKFEQVRSKLVPQG